VAEGRSVLSRGDRSWRSVGSWVLLAVVAAGCVYVVARNGETLADAFREIGWGPLLLSGVLALLGTTALLGVWVTLLHGMGAGPPRGEAWDVFFVTQLGKYIPGLVWPAVAQMESGRRWGARRRVMLAANLMLLVVLTATGAALGLVLLPWVGGTSEVAWWGWVLAALALVALWPPVLTSLLDRAFRLAGREPPGLAVTGRAMAGAVAWALVVWVLYGLHVWVLVRALGGTGADALVASVGGMALGWAFGLVAILAPAGVGVRDGILIAVLSPIIGRSPAFAVALASRGLLALSDVLLAASGALRSAHRLRSGASQQ